MFCRRILDTPGRTRRADPNLLLRAHCRRIHLRSAWAIGLGSGIYYNADAPLLTKSFTPVGIASTAALIASKAWSYGTGLEFHVSRMRPSYVVKVKELVRIIHRIIVNLLRLCRRHSHRSLSSSLYRLKELGEWLVGCFGE